MRFRIVCLKCGHPNSFISEEEPKEKAKKKSPRPRGAIEVFAGDAELSSRLSDTLQDVQMRWIKLYGDPQWIRHEMTKALNWLDSKKVIRKDFGKFMNHWLATAAKDHPQFKPRAQAHREGPEGLELEA